MRLRTAEIQVQSNIALYGLTGEQSGSALDFSSVISFPMLARIQLLICNLIRFLGPKTGLSRHHVFHLLFGVQYIIFYLDWPKQRNNLLCEHCSLLEVHFFVHGISELGGISGFRWLYLLFAFLIFFLRWLGSSSLSWNARLTCLVSLLTQHQKGPGFHPNFTQNI